MCLYLTLSKVFPTPILLGSMIVCSGSLNVEECFQNVNIYSQQEGKAKIKGGVYPHTETRESGTDKKTTAATEKKKEDEITSVQVLYGKQHQV